MTGHDRLDDITRFAAAVRAALGDLDAAERGHLLDDLEAHLAEVAAESDAPLIERLGPPERYAAELRTAYAAQSPRSRPAGPTGREPRHRRFPRRWQLVSLALVAGVAAAGWFAVAQVAGQRSKGDPWSYSQLVDLARTGHVRSVEISGSSAVATDRAGTRHDIRALPDDTSPLAAELTKDSVDITYQQTGGARFLLTVLLPNVVLLLLVALAGVVLYLVVRLLLRASPRTGWH